MSSAQAPLLTPGSPNAPGLAPSPAWAQPAMSPSDVKYTRDESGEIQYGNIHAGYKSSLDNLLTSKARLNRMKKLKEQAQEDDAFAHQDVDLYTKYVTAVKQRDRRFPEALTCLGCRRR